MFEDEDCPGYWDTRILQNQENYQSITQFKPLKLAILDQKGKKMASNIRNSPFFLMAPVNRCTWTLLARIPAKHLNSVPVNINIRLFGTAAYYLNHFTLN